MNPVGRSFRSGPSTAYSPPSNQNTSHSYSHYRPSATTSPYDIKEESASSFQPKYVQSFLSDSLTSPPLHSSPQQRFPSPEYTSRRHSRSVSPHRPRSVSRDDAYNGYDPYSSPKMNAMTLPDEAPPTESLYHLASSPSHSRHGSSSPLGMAGQDYSPMSVSSRSPWSGTTSPLTVDKPVSPRMMPPSHPPSTPTPLSLYPPSSLTKTSSLTAVNVFGFPPSVAHHVLTVFQQVGNLVQYQYTEGTNFMTLSYSSRIAAEKALKKNGRQVDVGGMAIMLGVVLVEPEVEQQVKRDVTPMFTRVHDDFSTPAKIQSAMTSPLARPTVLPGPNQMKREPVVYSPPSFHREPEPVQASSLFNRISEFFFGW